MAKRIYPTGPSHHNWKGGRYVRSDGYVEVYCPDHPNAGPRGYVLEHVLVASRVLGRPLAKDETVHHRNEIRYENQSQNLLICSRSFHTEIHARMKCMAEIGRPTTERPCQTCCKIIRPTLDEVKKGNGRYCSHRCHNIGRAAAKKEEART